MTKLVKYIYLDFECPWLTGVHEDCFIINWAENDKFRFALHVRHVSDPFGCWSPILLTLINLTPAWISNRMPNKVWEEITNPFPNFNGCNAEVWNWKSNFTPDIILNVITYLCCDLTFPTNQIICKLPISCVKFCLSLGYEYVAWYLIRI